MRFGILLSLLLAAGSAATAGTADLMTFRIKDQFDALHTDARYRGAPLLILWGDREGSEFMDDWDVALRDSLAQELRGYRLRTVQIAHGKGAPFFVKGRIKGVFRDRGDSPVLMDWSGEFRAAYRCREKLCNVLLFDGASRLAATWAVAETDAAALAEILAAARREVAGRDGPSR